MKDEIKDRLMVETDATLKELDAICGEIKEIEGVFRRLPLKKFKLMISGFGSGKWGDSRDEEALEWKDNRVMHIRGALEHKPLVESKAITRLRLYKYLDDFVLKGLEVLEEIKKKGYEEDYHED